MPDITLYVPKKRSQKIRDELSKTIAASRLTINVVEVDDIDEAIAVGPFGIVRSSKEIKIILNQLWKNQESTG